MTNNIVLYALVLISIGIGISALSNNSVDPNMATKDDISGLQGEYDVVFNSTAHIIKQLVIDRDNIDEIRADMSNLTSVVDTKLNAEAIANLNLRVTENEKAVAVLSAKKVIPTVPQELPKRTFNLATVNVASVPQEVFHMNDILYVIGDSAGTDSRNVSMKIRDSEGFVLVSKELGVPNSGMFTASWSVPDAKAGIYTITISDGKIVETINFEIQ